MSTDENRSRVTKYGYREIRLEDVPSDNPYAAPGAWNWGYIPEAKVVAAAVIGRTIRDDEVVHHKNGVPLDNSPDNLEVMDKLEHERMHAEWRKSKYEKEATALIRLAEARGIELFHDPSGATYATIRVGDHRETWSLESEQFARWLRELYYREMNGIAVGNDGVRDAIAALDGRATFDGPEHRVFIRIGSHDGKLYVDLCDDRRRAIEVGWDGAIEADRPGWRTVDEPPVRFTRSADMLPLPEPVHDPGSGAVDELRELLNIEEDDFMLALAWVVGCFNHEPPYMALEITGEHGSGKSSLSATLRSLVDPCDPALISPPNSEEGLVTIASTSWVMAFDNMSFLKNDMSDAYARLASGGAFKRRKLYTHSTITFKGAHPILFNGISDLVTRPDLQDRTISVRVPRIEHYIEDEIIRAKLDELRPRLLGAILSSIAYGMALQELKTTTGEPAIDPEIIGSPIGPTGTRIPSTRMKTAARWVALAIGRLLGRDGAGFEFLQVLEESKTQAAFIALDDSPLTPAIRLIAETGGFGFDADKSKNTLQELLQVIRYSSKPDDRKSKRFPDNAKGLANALRRLASSLHAAYGIRVEIDDNRTKHGYLVSISATDPDQSDDEGDQSGPVPSGASPALVEALKKGRVDALDPETNRREKERRRKQRDADDPRHWMTADRLDKERYERSRVSDADLADNPFYNRRFRNEEEYKAICVVVQFLRRFS